MQFQKPLLIGSRALQFNSFGNFKTRKETSDWDVICEKEQYQQIKDRIEALPGLGGFRVEWHDPEHLNNREFWDHFYLKSEKANHPALGLIRIAPQQALYVLKRSHAWRWHGVEKTMFHLHRAGLNKYKDMLTEEEQRILDYRMKLTKAAYPQGNPNLNQSVEDFFDDPVKKVYEHDWIHELYAYYDKPLFTRLQHDPAKAWCAKDLWERLSDTDKCKCVAEECYVIATERFLIPGDWKMPSRIAFNQALNKACTTLCSGWFRDWAIDNYGTIMELHDDNKVLHVKMKLEVAERDGHARYFKGKVMA